MDFLHAYTDWAGRRTNAPSIFHQFSGLVILDAALGNRTYLDAGWGLIYPPMWLCLLGRSGVRKTTAVNLAAGVLRDAQPDIELPHDFSREALYVHLAERPAGFLRWREMGSVLQTMQLKYMQGTKETLMDMWDSPPTMTRRTMAGKLIVVERPAVSILAAGKPHWFKDNISEAEVAGGFLARWLIVSSDESAPDQFFRQHTTPADEEQYQSLVNHLKRLGDAHGEIRVEPAGRDALERWLNDWQRLDWDEKSDPADLSSRAGTHIIKLAIGLEAAHLETQTIGAASIERACELWRWAFGCAQDLVAKIEHLRLAEIAERVLAKVPHEEEIVSRRDLQRAIKAPIMLVEAALRVLLDSGEIECEQRCPATGGHRYMVYWRPRELKPQHD